MLLFADESSFQLLPHVVHTYARRGKTPRLMHWKKVQNVYAISAISANGDLFYQTRDDRFKKMGIVHFLRYLLRQVKQKIILIWDGCTMHFTKEVKALLTTLKPERLELVKLPAHSPELNPDEQVWKYLKCETSLRNFAAKNFKELRQKVMQQFEGLKNKPERTKKMFYHPDCAYY